MFGYNILKRNFISNLFSKDVFSTNAPIIFAEIVLLKHVNNI